MVREKVLTKTGVASAFGKGEAVPTCWGPQWHVQAVCPEALQEDSPQSDSEIKRFSTESGTAMCI